jgi:hypothetical protein
MPATYERNKFLFTWSGQKSDRHAREMRAVIYGRGVRLVSLKFLRYEQDNGSCVLDGLLNEPQTNGTSATMGWT